MQQQKSYQENHKGILYLVPTPIGNLDDMTFRAVQILKQVDKILAEDTRHTQKLLNHFEITTSQLSYHEHNRKERLPEIIAKLEEGQQIAQVSDAGMPAISDPGYDLVQACLDAGITVSPLPGANAALTSLIASGLSTDQFTFIGFLSRKKNERKQLLEKLANHPYTLLFYESPFRIKQTLQELALAFGGERQAVVVRELTKKYEEFNRGSLNELQAYFTQQGEVKGEICLLVAGNANPMTDEKLLQEALNDKSIVEQVNWWITNQQMTNKAAIKQVAKQSGLSKREVYNAYHVEGSE